MQHLRVEMLEMQEDVVLVGAAAAALADLDGHRPAGHVARCQILGVGGIALHEALAFAVGQIAAFAARALGDQAAGAIDPGRMELDELHVLQRQAGAQHHRVAVAGTGVSLGCGEIGAPVAAGGEHHHVGAKPVDRTVFKVPRHDAVTDALPVHDQVEGKVLDKELGVVAQRLLVERMDDGVAGAVGGGAGAIGRGALAVLHHVAAERALIDLPGFGARERHPEMFELDNRRDRLAAHIFDRILVAKPVRPLDGVVHVPAPIVLAHIGERGADPALR